MATFLRSHWQTSIPITQYKLGTSSHLWKPDNASILTFKMMSMPSTIPSLKTRTILVDVRLQSWFMMLPSNIHSTGAAKRRINWALLASNKLSSQATKAMVNLQSISTMLSPGSKKRNTKTFSFAQQTTLVPKSYSLRWNELIKILEVQSTPSTAYKDRKTSMLVKSMLKSRRSHVCSWLGSPSEPRWNTTETSKRPTHIMWDRTSMISLHAISIANTRSMK